MPCPQAPPPWLWASHAAKEWFKFASVSKSDSIFFSNLDLPPSALEMATLGNFALAGHKIEASVEQLRQPRIVRIGAIQNRIILPTDAPISAQVIGSFI